MEKEAALNQQIAAIDAQQVQPPYDISRLLNRIETVRNALDEGFEFVLDESLAEDERIRYDRQLRLVLDL